MARRADLVLRTEVLLVLGISLGASAVYAVVSLAAKLTASGSLAEQTATLNPSRAPDRPWVDLAYQLLGVFFAVVPALLAVHLLGREPGDARARLGLDRPRVVDLVGGAGLAAGIGIPGLGLYVLARWLGLNATVVPAALPDHVWWAVPVLVLAAVQNAVLEEIVVVGYLVIRLRQFAWRAWTAVVASAVLRGSYHLYQGFGAFAGNVAMGIVFGYLFVRLRRIGPLIVAHTLLDVASFVGYIYVRDSRIFADMLTLR